MLHVVIGCSARSQARIVPDAILLFSSLLGFETFGRLAYAVLDDFLVHNERCSNMFSRRIY